MFFIFHAEYAASPFSFHKQMEDNVVTDLMNNLHLLSITNTPALSCLHLQCYPLPHFFFWLSFHPIITSPNFHLSTFVPSLISTITAPTPASILITLPSLLSPFSFSFCPVSSCSLFSHFIWHTRLVLDISLLPNSVSDTSYGWQAGQDPPFLRKLIESVWKWYSKALSVSLSISLSLPLPNHPPSVSRWISMSECVVVLVLLCQSCSARGVSLWFSSPL